ncbi:MAG: phosphoadenylyl-sulfate reductase [Bacteroidetes bacterium]|nr:phosphoadenylyl-sulfate reductase [Bacteroidota bacterium]
MKKEKIKQYLAELNDASVEDCLKFAVNIFGIEYFALASSFSIEDQVLTRMLLTIDPKAKIFTLDTGRLPQETYNTMDLTMKKYSFNYEFLFPESLAIEDMESKFGPNLFYQSIKNRKMCCNIRKVLPLQKKLSSLKCWVCGLRKEQSSTRTDVNILEWDENNGLFKMNPLANWNEQNVWDYLKEHNIPYNKLYDSNYKSIGCDPCTRAIQLGEDVRAGRWWWEAPEQKECGLHRR